VPWDRDIQQSHTLGMRVILSLAHPKIVSANCIGYFVRDPKHIGMEPRIQIARVLLLKNIRDFHLIGTRINELENGLGISGGGL
jgi:hypothetical protein